MKRLTILVLIVCMLGCTTLRPIGQDLPNLPQRIDSGELLKKGDRVVIVTKDGRTHKFTVSSLGSGTIAGDHESIPSDQVASIQRRELNVRKTVLLVVLTVVGIVIVVLAVGLHNGVGLPAGAA